MRIALLLLVASMAGAAQTPGTVQASGSASISVQPDMASVNVGVVTQADTAQRAADQNAADADAMIKALQSVLRNAGTIQTISYSLEARYHSPAPNQPAVLDGYTATNTVQVKTTDVALVGRLIDAATGARANSITGPTFGLQNPDPLRLQALTAAAKDAMAHAGAIAAGLGAKTGAVIWAQEGSTVSPILTGVASGSSGTPIQNGTVTVNATVSLTISLLQ